MAVFDSYGFSVMDDLSERKEPFFFMVDFLVEKMEIFTLEEINEKGLFIDFKNLKTGAAKDVKQQIRWKAFPESLESYAKGFHKVQQHLRKGNSYLVNYTRKTPIETNLSLEEIFYISGAKYKVYYPGRFVFFSPETFVEIHKDKICTHPMKGTIDASEADAEQKLRNSIKEKAEHYTVIDLLRNDLSMVADDVSVDCFQRIDLIRTRQKNLLAMSSEISGTLKEGFYGKPGSILRKLLPAGSILGAPKHKTLDIILEAENTPRGYYTGICGWFDGENLNSCVMIRFVEQENGQLYFRSGGGITHMSVLEEEYQEMKNKIYAPVY